MYKRQIQAELNALCEQPIDARELEKIQHRFESTVVYSETCLLYTSDAADERSSVDLGGRRIIKKKKQ